MIYFNFNFFFFSFLRLEMVSVSFRWLREGVLILNKSVAATGHSERST